MIEVLYLEDEQNQSIERFCQLAAENDVKVHLVNTREKLFAMIKDSPSDFPVIICDIEIWDDPDRRNKNRTLTCLGFSCIKELIEDKNELLPQYYILSNCSKRLHNTIYQDQVFKKIKISILSKDTIFTENGLNLFIQDINREGKRVLDSLKDSGIGDEVFDSIYQYIKDKCFFEEIEEDITQRALALIFYFEEEGHQESDVKFFKKEINVKDKDRKKIEEATFCKMALFIKKLNCSGKIYISKETNQFVSNDYERDKITIDSDFLFEISAKLEQKHVKDLQKPENDSYETQKTVKKFITKLILRRLAIYIHKIYSQKTSLNQKIARLTDVYPYLTPQDDAFLRCQLFMSGGAKYKITVKEKRFFKKYFNTTL